MDSLKTPFYILFVLFVSCVLNFGQPTFEFVSNLPSANSVLEIDSSGNFWAGAYDLQALWAHRYDDLGLFFSDDTGKTWKRIDLGEEIYMITSIAFNDSGKIFVGTDKGEIFKSDITVHNFVTTNFPGLFVETIVCNSKGDVFAGTIYDGVFRSTNEGDDWELTLDESEGYYYQIWKLFIDDNDNILAGSTCGLSRSTDNGDTWSFIEYFNCGDITAFAMSENGNIYMGGADRFDGVYRSTDHGLTWDLVFGGVYNFETHDLEVVNSGQIYVSTNHINGLFYSNVSRDTVWVSAGSGLFYPSVPRWLAYHPNGRLYLSIGASIYREKKPDTVFVHVPVPMYYSLEQNYPNPFTKGAGGNSTTTISYSLAQAGFVELKVFDILGNEVATLVHENKSAGEHTVNFNANSNLASGIYIYRLKTDNFVESKKMMLLK